MANGTPRPGYWIAPIDGRFPDSRIAARCLPSRSPSGHFGVALTAYSCGGSHGFGPYWVVRTVFPINPLEFIRRGTIDGGDYDPAARKLSSQAAPWTCLNPTSPFRRLMQGLAGPESFHLDLDLHAACVLENQRQEEGIVLGQRPLQAKQHDMERMRCKLR